MHLILRQNSEVTGAIEEMLEHDGPYLLQVKIDAQDNVWPLVPPNTANDKMMEST